MEPTIGPREPIARRSRRRCRSRRGTDIRRIGDSRAVELLGGDADVLAGDDFAARRVQLRSSASEPRSESARSTCSTMSSADAPTGGPVMPPPPSRLIGPSTATSATSCRGGRSRRAAADGRATATQRPAGRRATPRGVGVLTNNTHPRTVPIPTTSTTSNPRTMSSAPAITDTSRAAVRSCFPPGFPGVAVRAVPWPPISSALFDECHGAISKPTAG